MKKPLLFMYSSLYMLLMLCAYVPVKAQTPCGSTSDSSMLLPSGIPNPSFELKNCCPTTQGQVSCAQNWVQASAGTSDYFNCTFYSGSAIAAGLTPTDGTGMAGEIFDPTSKEYLGQCLPSPIIAGTAYKLTLDIAANGLNASTGASCDGVFFGPVDVTLYGTTNCGDLPFPGHSCPLGNGQWQIIGATSYTPAAHWSTITITCTPSSNINAIAIGAPCTLPASYTDVGSISCVAYVFFDNFALYEVKTTTVTCPPSATTIGVEISVPNVITPDGNGINDFFIVKNLSQYPGSSVAIFNRWGEKVFESSDYKNDWKADNLSDGTYFYILNVTDDKTYRGTVSVFHGKE